MDRRIQGGQRVKCAVRVRPPLHSDDPAGGEVRAGARKVTLLPPASSQSGPNDTYNASYVFDATSTQEDVYERSVAPIVTDVLEEGFNGCIVAFGESGTGKSYTLEGAGGPQQGMIPRSVRAIFDTLETKKSTLEAAMAENYSYSVGIRYIEIFEEGIRDLLDLRKSDLEVVDDEYFGPIVQQATMRGVATIDDAVEVYHQGKGQRKRGLGEYGPENQRTCSIFTIYVEQTLRGESEIPHQVSTSLMLVDMPGSEKLGANVKELRMKEGSLLNRGILSFGNLVRSLSDSRDVDFTDYSASKLTALLTDAFGGNCLTLVIATLGPGNYQNSTTTMQTVEKIAGVTNFPVGNDGAALNLMRRFRVKIRSHRGAGGNARAVGGSAPEDAVENLMRIHDLEGKLIEENFEKIRLKEERETLYNKLVEFRDRFAKLLEAKEEVEDKLISAEEERLKVTKLLLDIQIDYNKQQEQHEEEKFNLENKIIGLEGQYAEYVVKETSLGNERKQLQERIDSLSAENKEINLELVALKANYVDTVQQLKKEKEKCEEIGVELVNMINSNDALSREKDEWTAEQLRMKATEEQNARKYKEMQDNYENTAARMQEHKEENDRLRNEVAVLKLDLKQKQLDFDSQKVELQKNMTDFTRERDGENREVMTQKDYLQQQVVEYRRSLRQTQLQLEGCKSDLKRVESELVESQASVESWRSRFDELTHVFRKKLAEYTLEMQQLVRALDESVGLGPGTPGEMQDRQSEGKPATPLTGAENEGDVLERMQAFVEKMHAAQISTYETKEKQLAMECEHDASALSSIRKRNATLYTAYRKLRIFVSTLLDDDDARLKDIKHEDQLDIGDDDRAGEIARMEQEIKLQKTHMKRIEDEARQALTDSEQRAEEYRKMLVQCQAQVASTAAKYRRATDALQQAMAKDLGMRDEKTKRYIESALQTARDHVEKMVITAREKVDDAHQKERQLLLGLHQQQLQKLEELEALHRLPDDVAPDRASMSTPADVLKRKLEPCLKQIEVLEAENAKLKARTPSRDDRVLDDLRRENIRLKTQLAELDGHSVDDIRRAEVISHLKARVQELEEDLVNAHTHVSSARGGAGAGGDETTVLERVRAVTEGPLRELEERLASSESRCIVAEEQVTLLQQHITVTTQTYEEEIRKLRSENSILREHVRNATAAVATRPSDAPRPTGGSSSARRLRSRENGAADVPEKDTSGLYRHRSITPPMPSVEPTVPLLPDIFNRGGNTIPSGGPTSDRDREGTNSRRSQSATDRHGKRSEPLNDLPVSAWRDRDGRRM